MWKTIYSIDLNLLIGIIGGIISGIFVRLFQSLCKLEKLI